MILPICRRKVHQKQSSRRLRPADASWHYCRNPKQPGSRRLSVWLCQSIQTSSTCSRGCPESVLSNRNTGRQQMLNREQWRQTICQQNIAGQCTRSSGFLLLTGVHKQAASAPLGDPQGIIQVQPVHIARRSVIAARDFEWQPAARQPRWL